MDATAQAISHGTNAQDAAKRLTGLRNAFELRQANIDTLYNANAWEQQLIQAGLLDCYPNILSCIQIGFNAGILTITTTYTPSNNPSIEQHQKVVDKIIQVELDKGHYIRPLFKMEVKALVGHF